MKPFKKKNFTPWSRGGFISLESIGNENLVQFFRIYHCFRIGEVIDEDVLHARVPFVARTQQCFAVKAGIDGLLDISRRSFCDTSEGLDTICLL